MKIPLNKRGSEAEGFRGLSREPARADANKTTPKALMALPPLIRGNHSFSFPVAPPPVSIFMLNGAAPGGMGNSSVIGRKAQSLDKGSR
ncbi:MAG: hypothetical protein DMG06_28540 [Acidobacteria bacterium]|nr:MAG: hypothetical protein DMG06_28540 [Acidobacteriota bacterium]